MAFNLADYETVESRLEKWWKDYPDGRVATKIEQASDTRYIVSAELFRTEADAKAYATGLASESVSDRGVNSTSALENCETSAIGRALANAGYAAKGKRASREEMSKVNEKQFTPKYGSPGSKSAAMEYALHIVDTQLKYSSNEPVPVAWSIGDSVSKIGEVPAVGFICRHGDMVKKEGIAKSTNRPFAGYVCSAPKGDQCDAKWAKLTSAGTWFWPDDAESGKGGE